MSTATDAPASPGRETRACEIGAQQLTQMRRRQSAVHPFGDPADAKQPSNGGGAVKGCCHAPMSSQSGTAERR
jgi:hypothetical protein